MGFKLFVFKFVQIFPSTARLAINIGGRQMACFIFWEGGTRQLKTEVLHHITIYAQQVKCLKFLMHELKK